jgi:DnaJ-class molecular chaperone
MKRIYETCPVCKGQGYITITDWTQPVGTNGIRLIWTESCKNCKGMGVVKTRYWMEEE